MLNKRNIKKHIIIELFKTSEKEKILQPERNNVTYRERDKEESRFVIRTMSER